jgi:hypothetical protein
MNDLSNYLKSIFVYYFKLISCIFGVRVQKEISPDFILEYKSTPYKDYKCWIIDKRSNKKSDSFSAPRKCIMMVQKKFQEEGIIVFDINTKIFVIMRANSFEIIHTCDPFEKILNHLYGAILVETTTPGVVRFIKTSALKKKGNLESKEIKGFDCIKQSSKSIVLVATENNNNNFFIDLETMQLSPTFQAFEIVDNENALVCVGGAYFIISLSIMGFKTHLPTIKKPEKITDGYYLLTDQDGSLGIYDLVKNDHHQSLGSEIEKTSQNGLFLISDNSKNGSVKQKFYFSPMAEWESLPFVAKRDISEGVSLAVAKNGVTWLIDYIHYHETEGVPSKIIELGNNCFHIIYEKDKKEQFATIDHDNNIVYSETFYSCKQIDNFFVAHEKDMYFIFSLHKGFSDIFLADKFSFDSKKREIIFQKNNPITTIRFLVEDFTYTTQIEF